MNGAASPGTPRGKEVGAQSIKPHTIVICEANPILAEGIQKLLQSSTVLSDYRSIIQLNLDPSAVLAVGPAVLIIDPWQAAHQREVALDLFHDLSADVPVICYYPEISPGEASAASTVGFRGIVPKTVEGETLVQIVCAVVFGGTYVSDFISKYQKTPSDPPAVSDVRLPSLSEREIDVLRKIALGKSMKEIAILLQISIKTVDTYKTRASQKLDLRTRADIVKYAIQSGWMNRATQPLIVK